MSHSSLSAAGSSIPPGPTGSPAARRGLGLSTPHISPHAPSGSSLVVPVGGSVVRLAGPKGMSREQSRPGGLRGKITVFSRSSRRRLLFMLGSINRKDCTVLPLFVTLTYPSSWPDDPKEWKRHLDVFIKRLRRRYPEVCVIWRLEPQQRGAPHYHLLIFGVSFLPKQWLSQNWFQVVGSGDDRHLRAGTQVAQVKSWKGVMSYASKYIGKISAEVADLFGSVGRWWGVYGREFLPIQLVKMGITSRQFFNLRRILRGFLRSRGVRLPHFGRFSGCSAFIDADFGMRLLEL